jgi:hypothetical protein
MRGGVCFYGVQGRAYGGWATRGVSAERACRRCRQWHRRGVREAVRWLARTRNRLWPFIGGVPGGLKRSRRTRGDPVGASGRRRRRRRAARVGGRVRHARAHHGRARGVSCLRGGVLGRRGSGRGSDTKGCGVRARRRAGARRHGATCLACFVYTSLTAYNSKTPN